MKREKDMRDMGKKDGKNISPAIKIALPAGIVAIALIILAFNYMAGRTPGWHDSGERHSYYVLENGEQQIRKAK